jgi:drug/metabolite transporter (DMT)-like permease
VADEPLADQPPAPRRAEPGELISAACALVLLALMFFAKWFGVDRLPGQASGVQRETAENAWQGLTLLRWLMLLTILIAVGSLVLHATQRSHGTTNDTGGVVAALGTLTALLLVYRVLIELPSSNQVVDQKFGAILGVLFALGIALGGHASMREQRSRAGLERRSRPQSEGVAPGTQAR